MANLYSPGNQARNQAYNMTLGGSAEDVQNRLNAAYYLPNSTTRTYGGSSGSGGGSSSGGGGASAGGGYGGMYSGARGSGMHSGAGGSVGANYQAQFDAARAANESRYNTLLTNEDNLYSRVMGNVNQGNAQATADLSRSFDQQGARSQQDMISRGLTGSTIAQTMSAGNERNRQGSLNRQAEAFRREQVGYDTALTGQRQGIIERRTDSYPEMSELIALAQLNGQGGGGRGGAGSYGTTAGSPYAALQSAFGPFAGGLNQLGQMPAQIFGGNSMHAGIAATSARQGANTRNVYAHANNNPGYNFNSGYSLRGNSGSGYDQYSPDNPMSHGYADRAGFS